MFPIPPHLFKSFSLGVFMWLFILPGSVQAAESANASLETLSASVLADLVPQLRKGGFVFYFRHASSRLDQQDKQPIVKADCATQRNLSEEGKQQALVIGKAFKEWHLPVGEVLSSPFCRCKDTAMLAFGRAHVVDDLYFAIGLNKTEREAKGAALRLMLSDVPAAGKNSVIVAHTANLEETAGFWPKPEAAAILFQPDGNGGYRVVGRIPPESWPGMVGR